MGWVLSSLLPFFNQGNPRLFLTVGGGSELAPRFPPYGLRNLRPPSHSELTREGEREVGGGADTFWVSDGIGLGKKNTFHNLISMVESNKVRLPFLVHAKLKG